MPEVFVAGHSMALSVPGSCAKMHVLGKVAPVQRFPLFGDVAADCREIVSLAHEGRCSRRQTVFQRSDPVRDVIMLRSGNEKIARLSHQP